MYVITNAFTRLTFRYAGFIRKRHAGLPLKSSSAIACMKRATSEGALRDVYKGKG